MVVKVRMQMDGTKKENQAEQCATSFDKGIDTGMSISDVVRI